MIWSPPWQKLDVIVIDMSLFRREDGYPTALASELRMPRGKWPDRIVGNDGSELFLARTIFDKVGSRDRAIYQRDVRGGDRFYTILDDVSFGEG